MKRGSGRVMIEITVTEWPDGWWWAELDPDQRNDIRDRIDSICDDLNKWKESA